MAQREFKFRGLSVLDNTWRFGYLVFDTDAHKDFAVEAFIFGSRRPFDIENKCENLRHFDIIKGTEGQLTGRKDCNDKEIYEGDILEYVSYMRDENKRKEIVEFDEKCGGWYVHKQADTLADVLFKQHNEDWQIKQNYKPSIKHKVRVIGNIYETPEFTQTTS